MLLILRNPFDPSKLLAERAAKNALRLVQHDSIQTRSSHATLSFVSGKEWVHDCKDFGCCKFVGNLYSISFAVML